MNLIFYQSKLNVSRDTEDVKNHLV